MAAHDTDAPGGTAGDDALGEPLVAPRWPLSAVCAVAVSSSLVIVLLLMNVAGVHIGRGYDATVAGSIADWFEAFSTLVAVPAAVLIGARQLQQTTQALELNRRQMVAEVRERAERRAAEQALLADAVRVRVATLNVVDAPDLATDAERAAVERWRAEYRQRGWTPDAAGTAWLRDGARRTNAGQLTAEPSPLLPTPWLVAVEIGNDGPATVLVQGCTIAVAGQPTTLRSPFELRQGDTHRQRLGAEVGLQPAYAKQGDADAATAAVSLVIDASDAAGRPLRVRHPRGE